MKKFLQTLPVILCLQAALSLPAAPLQMVGRYVSPAEATAAVTGPLAPSRELEMTIELPWRNGEALTNLLEQLQEPGSPNYHRYLTPAQFAVEFGPSEEDYQAVIAFARNNRLTVTRTNANRELLDVRGTVASINQALHVTMMEFQHPTEGRTFYAPDKAPSLNLAVAIQSISGLDNFTLPHPLFKLKPIAAGQSSKPTPAEGSGPNGLLIGGDFRNAYAPDATQKGEGQSVALLEFDGYYPQDIAAYEKTAGLAAVPLTNVLINTSGAVFSANGDAEVSLDIDMAISMAPKLNSVLVYESGSSASDMISRMAQDDLANQISCSWGFEDASVPAILQELAAQGQTFFAAAGDGDAYTSGSIFEPTDDPYTTSVGGTTLTTTSGGAAYSSEVVWNAGGGEGTGGGVSPTYDIPYWQTNINLSAVGGSKTHRNVPDVAMNADNVYLVYENGQVTSVVGTSCAAPLWAAFNAMANELAAQNGMGRDGYINPLLYSIAESPAYASTFHDTTIGNNESPSSPSHYVAATGYDLCTGWGSPRGLSLLYAVGLPEPLRIAPFSVPPFAGPAGGPFGPAEITFTLTNGSSGPLVWGLANPSPYFKVAPTNGTLASAAVTSVIVTLNSAVSNLAVGAYSSTLSFTNVSDSVVQTRTVTLLVAGPPVILTQPTNQVVLGGETAVFEVAVGANSQLAYQWWKTDGLSTNALTDDGRITGSTSAILNIAGTTNTDIGSYYVVVSNAAGSITSSAASLTLKASAPVIVSAPTNQLVYPGDAAHFAVTVIGTPPFTYQWKFAGTNLINGALVSGVNSDSLAVSNVTAGWAGLYTVVVINALGTNSASAELSVVPVTAPGASLSTLYSFAGGASGQNPTSGLVTTGGSPVNFYGTTLYGGTAGYGTTFRMSPNGTLLILSSFTGTPNETYPVANLSFNKNNFFYSVSALGGNSDDGTVYRMNPAGQVTLIKSFTGIDGTDAETALLLGKDAAYYGTTLSGGIYGLGNVFRVTTAGAFSNLVSFDGVNGNFPLGSLIQDASSNLIGTSELGGFDGDGNVFMITPSGQMRTLVSFTGDDGAVPVAGLTLDALGNMYGTTHDGGLYGEGEVYELFPDGSGVVLYAFGGATNDGFNPYASLALGSDGNLYGSTEAGGQFGYGTVFVVSPDGNLTTLASFDGFQGEDPAGSLLENQGSWYGTTFSGGLNGLGAIFKLTVSGALQITGQPADQVVELGGSGLFQVATLGSEPVTYQWRMDGTNLADGNGISGSATRLLTVSGAAPSSAGVYSVVVSNVFGAVTSAPALLQVLISTPVVTEQPVDESIMDGQTAMMSVQAIGDYPLSYQWLFDGQALTNNARVKGVNTPNLLIRQATNSDSGSYSVIVYDDLYQTQSSNALLSVTPPVAAGYALETLHSFSGIDGSQPYASLVQARDGKLYGTAPDGGHDGEGAVFDITTNGLFTLLYSFTGANDGSLPFAGLVQGVGADANLYGTAASGGIDGEGAFFRLTSAHVFSALSSFNGSDGDAPEGTLVEGPRSRLYGTTAIGGDFDSGTIFSSTVGGVVTTLYSFTGFDDGYEPLSGPTVGPDGNLYGTAYLGGTNNYGTLYKVKPTGDFTLLHAFNGLDGAFPVAGPTLGPDGRFYGTAFTGGAQGFGTVFAFTTNGDFTLLHTFDYNNGAFPNAGLVAAGNGQLIGATQNGGPGGAGGIYEIATNGAWTPLIWFSGPNGASPLNTPVRASDGYFYGTTYYGGVSNLGCIYRFSVPALPQIVSQPADVAAAPGSSASFDVSASSSTPLGYQWFFDGAAIAGATNASYSIAAVSNENVGSYYVLLSNAGGATNSRVAQLTLTAPLLSNGGFETGDFTDWTLSGKTQGLSVQTGAQIAHSGTYGARIASSGSLGYLTMNVATTNGVSYRLSLWLDSPDGLGPNEFAVTWNGGVLLDQTNVPALGWTNLQFLVTATNSGSAIGIGARDDASFLAVDDVTLLPVPQLQTTSITQTPGQPAQIHFNWSGSPGLRYQVQYKDALGEAEWQNLGAPFTSVDGTAAIADFLTNSQRFYRIVLLP